MHTPHYGTQALRELALGSLSCFTPSIPRLFTLLQSTLGFSLFLKPFKHAPHSGPLCLLSLLRKSLEIA